MSLNTYCNPKVTIQDVGVVEAVKGTIMLPGQSQLSSMKLTFDGDWAQGASLMNKKIKFYLNEGSEDTLPFFIGYIKQIAPKENSVSITAYDARCFITGEYAPKIDMTDFDNYDGYTLAGFINSYVNEYINIDQTLLDVDTLRDTDPPVVMNGMRATNKTPYQILLEAIKDAIKEEDMFNVFDYEIGVNYTTDTTKLVFIRQKRLDKPCMSYSLNNGIQSYQYKKAQIPNRGKIDNIKVDYGGFSNDKRYIKDVANKVNFRKLGNKTETNALKHQAAIKALIRSREELYTITLNANKGHYLQLGQTVYLNIDSEIKGTHRITSKTINFGPNGSTVSFKLNSRPIEIGDYY